MAGFRILLGILSRTEFQAVVLQVVRNRALLAPTQLIRPRMDPWSTEVTITVRWHRPVSGMQKIPAVIYQLLQAARLEATLAIITSGTVITS